MPFAQFIYISCGVKNIFSLTDTLAAFFAFQAISRLGNSILVNANMYLSHFPGE